jgi:hypothetical protein
VDKKEALRLYEEIVQKNPKSRKSEIYFLFHLKNSIITLKKSIVLFLKG